MWTKFIKSIYSCIFIIFLVAFLLPFIVEKDNATSCLQPTPYWAWVLCLLSLGASIVAWKYAKKILSLALALLFIFATVMLLPLLISHIYSYKIPETMNELGDIYGSLNTLFSGLAFTAILITILLQQKQIKQQQKEIDAAEQQQRFERCFKLIDWNRESLSMIKVNVKKSEALTNGFVEIHEIISQMVENKNDLNSLDTIWLTYYVNTLLNNFLLLSQETAQFSMTLDWIIKLSEQERDHVLKVFMCSFDPNSLFFFLTACIYSGMEIDLLDRMFSYRKNVGLEGETRVEAIFIKLIDLMRVGYDIPGIEIAKVLNTHSA